MYIFYTSASESVGFAYSTMHCISKAQKVSNERKEVINIYLESGTNKAFYGTVAPKVRASRYHNVSTALGQTHF